MESEQKNAATPQSMPQGARDLLLKELMALDSSAASIASGAHAEALGDAYLLAHNRLYDAVRRAVLALGFSIDASDTLDYLTFQLIELPRRLTRKNLCLVDNVSALRRLEDLRPGFFTTAHLARLSPQGNYLTHESCHVLAEHLFPKVATSQQQSVLRLLLCESFANTADLLLYFYAVGDDKQPFFLRLNTYLLPHQWICAPELTALAQALPMAQLAKLIIILYLLANLGYMNPTKTQLRQALAEAKIDFAEGSYLWDASMTLFNQAMTLSKGFVLDTSEIFLNAQGFDGSVIDLTKFCPFEMLGAWPDAAFALESMASFFPAPLAVP